VSARALFSALAFCFIFCSCFQKKQEQKTSEALAINKTDTDTVLRTNITFILGKDEGNRNPYYSLANLYYRISDSERTEIVIDSLFSLLQVRNYLENHCPDNGHPWGLINLVSHGNEFVDLSVLTTPTGSRVSTESLLELIRDSTFIPLDSDIIDRKTLLNLHGCAVGNNTELINTIGIAFGSANKPAKVKASKLFEYYAYTSHARNPKAIRHFYAKAWYAFYKADTIPDDSILVNQLKERYPYDSIDWLSAVRRQYPDNPSQAYHMNLNIPIVWEDFYENKNQLPDLRSKTKQNKWINDKYEFLALMNKTHIPREYFSIKFYRLNYDTDSAVIYSSKIKAKAGVVCIIRPEVEKPAPNTTGYLPFVPKSEDSLYFSFSKTF
jgi:hypothetical protein